jgi:hypothetical protein
MAQYYDYKNKKSYEEMNFSCKKCNWSGKGEQCSEGIDSSSGFPVLCPKCDEYIEWIDITVSLETLLEYGTEEEKARAREQQAFYDRVRDSRSLTCDKLPEIEAEEIVITLREIQKGDNEDGFIVLYWGDKEIWREIRTFEYYERFIEIGQILKEKYGKKFVDFDMEYTVYLGGDSLSAFDKVRKFRKSLSSRDNMSDAEFDFVTQRGQFNKDRAVYWKALEFARKRHEGQTRNEGTPYFSHIEGTIEILRQCGKISDYLFTIAALHDVLEDTETTKEELYTLLQKIPNDYTIAQFMHLYECDEIKAAEMYDLLNNSKYRDIIAEVELLTKSGGSFKEYIDRIFIDDSIKREKYYYNGAKVVKLADRLHNLTTLHLCGKPEKIQRYIRETEEFIMPWRDKYKDCEVLFTRIEKRLGELKEMQN